MVQSNKPACGGARQGGNRAGSAQASFLSRWVRIFLITSGSWIQAMIRSAPPQAAQVSISMPKTRLRRCAQLIAARRSAGVGSSGSALVACRPPLPRLAGVTRARYVLFGAKIPWKRVRLTRDLGTRAW